jgi:iron-sulfur cluster assembly protein
VKSGGCSGLEYVLKFDNEKTDTDQIFEDNDIKIIVDKKSILYLAGTILEYSGGLNGKGFVFNNPNASRTCGCGESFLYRKDIKIIEIRSNLKSKSEI